KFGQLQVEGVSGNIAEPLILNGTGPLNDGALLNIAGNNTWTGPVTLDADSTIGARAGSTLTIQGVITDTGVGHALTKEGAGTVTLDPINAPGTAPQDTGNRYRGKTFVNDGILRIRHSMALGNSPSPSNDPTTGNQTIVQSFTNRSGTLQLDVTQNDQRIDPNAIFDGNIQTGFVVPNELLTLNGPGFEGIHVFRKQAGANGTTVSGALNNRSGDNTWVQNISLWSTDSAMVVNTAFWAYPTVGIGAEANTTLTITAHINDSFIAGSSTLPTIDYS